MLLIRAANLVGDEPQVRQNEFAGTDCSFTGTEILKQRIWSTCAPFYIFQRQFLLRNNLKFMEGVFHEDNEFTPRMLCAATDVRLVNDVLYFVWQNPNSITRSVNYKKSFDLIKVARSLSDYCRSNVTDEDVRLVFHQFISLNINNALHGTAGMTTEMQADFCQQLRQHRHLLGHLRKSGVIKYVIEGLLFSLTSQYVTVYRQLCKLKI